MIVFQDINIWKRISVTATHYKEETTLEFHYTSQVSSIDKIFMLY